MSPDFSGAAEGNRENREAFPAGRLGGASGAFHLEIMPVGKKDEGFDVGIGNRVGDRGDRLVKLGGLSFGLDVLGRLGTERPGIGVELKEANIGLLRGRSAEKSVVAQEFASGLDPGGSSLVDLFHAPGSVDGKEHRPIVLWFGDFLDPGGLQQQEDDRHRAKETEDEQGEFLMGPETFRGQPIDPDRGEEENSANRENQPDWQCRIEMHVTDRYRREQCRFG